jgi:histone-binding protein RBBP4
MVLRDIRAPNVISCIKAHDDEIGSIDFNYFNPSTVLSASKDNTIALWDMRNLSQEIFRFNYPRHSIIHAKWSPNDESLFASSSSQGKVLIWDVDLINDTRIKEEIPPELVVNY